MFEKINTVDKFLARLMEREGERWREGEGDGRREGERERDKINFHY